MTPPARRGRRRAARPRPRRPRGAARARRAGAGRRRDRAERARPGGAGLAARARRSPTGAEVTLVTALGDDAGRRGAARRCCEPRASTSSTSACDGATPEKIRVLAGGRPVAAAGPRRRADAPSAPLTRGPRRRSAAPTRSSSPTTGAASPPSRPSAPRSARRDASPVVWDPHPRGAAPVPGARARHAQPGRGRRRARTPASGAPRRRRGRRARVGARRGAGAPSHVARDARRARRRCWCRAATDPPLAVPAPPSPAGDPCGAGDRFAGAPPRRGSRPARCRPTP